MARAFGAAVRAVRTNLGVAQEALALQAKVERSHLGKIERGERMTVWRWHGDEEWESVELGDEPQSAKSP